MNGTSTKTGNPWMKQEYVIEMSGEFPRHCVFSVFGEDRINRLDIKDGEELTVLFNVDARENKGRWYNDFKAYNVIRGQLPQPVQQTPASDKTNMPMNVPDVLPFSGEGEETDILPF